MFSLSRWRTSSALRAASISTTWLGAFVVTVGPLRWWAGDPIEMCCDCWAGGLQRGWIHVARPVRSQRLRTRALTRATGRVAALRLDVSGNRTRPNTDDYGKSSCGAFCGRDPLSCIHSVCHVPYSLPRSRTSAQPVIAQRLDAGFAPPSRCVNRRVQARSDVAFRPDPRCVPAPARRPAHPVRAADPGRDRVLLLVPFAVALFATNGQTRADITFTDRERDGVAYLRPLVRLLSATVDAQNAAVAGRPAYGAALQTAGRDVEEIDTRLVRGAGDDRPLGRPVRATGPAAGSRATAREAYRAYPWSSSTWSRHDPPCG